MIRKLRTHALNAEGKASEGNFVRLMVDSGAFSVWVKGETIAIEDYTKYIKKYEHLIDSYIVLDQISGRPGHISTQAEDDAAAEITFQNFKYMKKEGLDPIPVFHQGERFAWLDRYLNDESCKYIAISCDKMLDAKTRRLRVSFLDQVFSRLTDERGYPIVKTHGLGITSIPLMLRYPWFSVDSTTWSLIASYGFIACPVYAAGRPDYLREPVFVHMSNRVEMERVTARHGRIYSKRFAGDGKKFEHLGPMMQKCVRHFVEEECGEHFPTLFFDDNIRRRCVIKFFQNMVAQIGDNPRFAHRRKVGIR